MRKYMRKQTLVLVLTIVVIGILIVLVMTLPQNKSTLAVAAAISAVILCARLFAYFAQRRPRSGRKEAAP